MFFTFSRSPRNSRCPIHLSRLPRTSPCPTLSPYSESSPCVMSISSSVTVARLPNNLQQLSLPQMRRDWMTPRAANGWYRFNKPVISSMIGSMLRRCPSSTGLFRSIYPFHPMICVALNRREREDTTSVGDTRLIACAVRLGRSCLIAHLSRLNTFIFCT